MASISCGSDTECNDNASTDFASNVVSQNGIVDAKSEQCVQPHYYRNNKGPLYRALDQKVLNWVRTKNKKKHTYNGPMLQNIARGIAMDLGITDFKGSTTWVERFKGRHSEVVCIVMFLSFHAYN